MTGMPTLATERLIIRPFTLDDLDDIHRILDIEHGQAGSGIANEATTLDERRDWLQWSILNYEQLAKMSQPPYGDRAIALRQTQQLIGACGYVPCLNVFGQLGSDRPARFASTEFGLFWALSPTHQRKGYATEAARALIDYAFKELHLGRVVATTSYDNVASLGVMRKLGMRIEKNPFPDPPWLQVVGVLEA